MFKRVAYLSVASFILLPALACAEASDAGSSFGSFTTQTTFGQELGEESETSDTNTGDGDGDATTGDGDGDGDPTGDGDSTTGDGDSTTGDGDGDGDGDPTTGDGDGDPTGDGDGDIEPDCGNGVIDPGETCDGNNFGGVTCVDLGFDQGALTCTGCAVDTSSCMNSNQPGLGQLYSHCLVPESCPNLDGCATVSMEGDAEPYDGFCTNFCVSDAECFANTGGTAVARCNTEASPFCELDCAGGKTCPGGMECVPLQGGKELCY